MDKNITVKLEIGPELKASITALLNTVNKENKRLIYRTVSPGEEIRKAFGIDIADIIKSTVELRVNQS